VKRNQALAHLPYLAADTTRFANVNSAKNVWWLDIPISKINGHINLSLALYDDRRKKLFVLDVPPDFFRENEKSISIRIDRQVVSLELSAEDSRIFENTRPVNSGLSFRQFLVRTLDISL